MTFGEVLGYIAKNHDFVTAGTAVLALFVSLISIILTAWSMLTQRSHNRRSVLPIGHISFGDYEDDIFVRLRNDGVGPMIVEKLSVTMQGSDGSKDALIDYMPDLPKGVFWSTFVEDISGRAISAEKDLVLIRLQGELNNPKFAKCRRSVRAALSTLSIKVEYKNIYEEKMAPTIRSLNWFGRHT